MSFVLLVQITLLFRLFRLHINPDPRSKKLNQEKIYKRFLPNGSQMVTNLDKLRNNNEMFYNFLNPFFSSPRSVFTLPSGFISVFCLRDPDPRSLLYVMDADPDLKRCRQ